MEVATSQKVIERYGWLTKEEPISNIADENLDLNIMILESTTQFYGYYGDQPKEEKPDQLYWVFDQYYPQEQLFRAFQTIRINCFNQLDATPGNIKVSNETFFVVRMHNLKRYNQIHTVQAEIEKLGLKLRKNNRQIKNQMGMIYLNKFFHLNLIDEGLYSDIENPHSGYFTIPHYVNWEDFKILTREVKYDTSLIFFDAASAAFFEDGNITNLVRIYRENLTVEQIISIRERYMKVLLQRYA